MRQTLEAVALILLLTVWGVTSYALLGRDPLPPQIPTHFDLAGKPDAWGMSTMLWVLPIVATVIYLLMTVVALFPSSFNFPMRTSAATRPQLEGIALNMIASLKAEVVLLFTWIQVQTIRFAHTGHAKLPQWILPVALVVVFGTIAWHIAAMRRAGRVNFG
jgi:uncharacterized membrane protein